MFAKKFCWRLKSSLHLFSSCLPSRHTTLIQHWINVDLTLWRWSNVYSKLNQSCVRETTVVKLELNSLFIFVTKFLFFLKSKLVTWNFGQYFLSCGANKMLKSVLLGCPVMNGLHVCADRPPYTRLFAWLLRKLALCKTNACAVACVSHQRMEICYFDFINAKSACHTYMHS